MKALSKGLVVTVVFTLATSVRASQPSARALYRALLPNNAHAKMVESIEIAVAPERGRPGLCWHRLSCRKVGGEKLGIWFLADGNPMVGDVDRPIDFKRYILAEPNRPPIEYVERRSGRALLPVFDFRSELLPRAAGPADEFAFERGTFLGHPLIRQEVLAPEPIGAPENIERQVFDPELLIGTSRNFKDDGKGRKSSKDNYNYVAFTRENYDEMIAAGINYFTARGEQVDWICHRPVFYEGYSRQIAFPEELFRSNFLGLRQFIDEPACRLAGKYARDATPKEAVEMIQRHIRERLNNTGYRNVLAGAGIDPGTLKLAEPPVPIWETYVGTSYYQLETDPAGFLQECRWCIESDSSDRGRMLQRINAEFGTSIPVTPRNLFLWYYSQMIGPARAFTARWGMSIYGQSEPGLRIASMELAYDLGASYIWFWTSDHDHHVPYTEQLQLARAITQYARKHPRRPLEQILRRAGTAIVLPYGYTLPSCWELDMFGSYIFTIRRKNELGLTYKEVLAPAVSEIERCLRNDIAYDVVPAGENFDASGYGEIIRIERDGGVRRSKIR